jgi:ADP-ribosylglycohydrolase
MKIKAEIVDMFRVLYYLGLAVGDTLGVPLEFTIPGSFQPVNDMIGGGPFHIDLGMWTDDTSIPHFWQENPK